MYNERDRGIKREKGDIKDKLSYKIKHFANFCNSAFKSYFNYFLFWFLWISLLYFQKEGRHVILFSREGQNKLCLDWVRAEGKRWRKNEEEMEREGKKWGEKVTGFTLALRQFWWRKPALFFQESRHHGYGKQYQNLPLKNQLDYLISDYLSILSHFILSYLTPSQKFLKNKFNEWNLQLKICQLLP